MNRRITRTLWLVAASAAVGGIALTALPTAQASGKDDPVKVKAARDAYRKNCKDKYKKWPYFDLSYGVDLPPKVDSRWTAEEVKDAAEDKGPMLRATFSMTAAQGSEIRMYAHKFLHKSLDGKSEFSYSFDRAGKNPKTSDPKGMIEGFYLEQVKTYKEVKKEECVEPKKLKLGPADLFASVSGLDPTSNQKERMDYYVWTAPNTTYIIMFTYTGIYAKQAENFQDKVTDLVKATSELKNVPD